MDSVVVEELIQSVGVHLDLTLMAGKRGIKKRITHPQVQKMGLAIAGFTKFVNPGRLQIIGKSEMVYLGTLTPGAQQSIIEKMCSLEIACLVVTWGLDIPEQFLKEADVKGVPLFRTNLTTTDFIDRITKILEWKLAPTTSVHGVLMDVFGVGVFLLGKSGIGKSECALDLIVRGHRLVADDMVFIQKRPPSSLFGSGFEVIQHHMEIRGLGIINIRSLFGVEAIRERKKIELVVELMAWEAYQEVDRLGFEEEKYTILDVELPLLRIPVTPGRDLTTIVEVAARNHLLKTMGFDSAVEFEKKLLRKMEEGATKAPDFEGEVE